MRLLLDSHVAVSLAVALRRNGVDAVALSEWKEGEFRSASDEEILAEAHRDGRVLVTFDLQTIPLLLKEIAETGGHHGGVVLVSSRAFRANDIGALLRALLALAEGGERDWRDVAVYLR